MRRVVRAAYLGLDPGDLSALDDPTTIEAIRRAGAPARRRRWHDRPLTSSEDIVTWEDLADWSPTSPTPPRRVRRDARDHARRPRPGRDARLPPGIRNILVAAVEYYDDEGRPGPKPTFLQFPADPLLRGQRVLIVDEVWDSGTTIHAVTERVRQAGGIPTTASSTTSRRIEGPGRARPHAVTTDRWVVYPFKAGG